MPEVLEVLAEEVRPFDVLDEGVTVRAVTWHYEPSVIVMSAGLLHAEEEDGVIYPAWSHLHERTRRQGELVKVVRGLRDIRLWADEIEEG